MYYPFAYAVDRARKSGFASLTEAEKWDWHADVYGWRAAALGRDETTSPCDPDGRWYDPQRAGIATAHHRGRRAARPRATDADDAAGGRQIIDAWLRGKGHADAHAYAAATGGDWSDAYARYAAEQAAAAQDSQPRRGRGPRSVGAVLGMVATETRAFQLPPADDPGVLARLREMGDGPPAAPGT